MCFEYWMYVKYPTWSFCSWDESSTSSWLSLWHCAIHPSSSLNPGSQPSAVLILSLMDTGWRRGHRLKKPQFREVSSWLSAPEKCHGKILTILKQILQDRLHRMLINSSGEKQLWTRMIFLREKYLRCRGADISAFTLFFMMRPKEFRLLTYKCGNQIDYRLF